MTCRPTLKITVIAPPLPEDEETVLYSSDSEEGEEEEEPNDTETVYFQEGVSTSPPFEARLENKSSRPEEEEVEATEPENVEEEVFEEVEKADFLKNNFEDLAKEPVNRSNPMRLSISSKFLANPPKTEPKNNLTQAIPDEKSEAKIQAKMKKESLLQEVERTRQRLAQLGIIVPRTSLPGTVPKGTKDTTEQQPSPSGNQIQTDSNSIKQLDVLSEPKPAEDKVDSPSQVEPEQPEQSKSENQQEQIEQTNPELPSQAECTTEEIITNQKTAGRGDVVFS